MKNDVENYIGRRKRTDKAFAKDFDAGYADFKIGAMLRQAREDLEHRVVERTDRDELRKGILHIEAALLRREGPRAVGREPRFGVSAMLGGPGRFVAIRPPDLNPRKERRVRRRRPHKSTRRFWFKTRSSPVHHEYRSRRKLAIH